MGGKKSASLMFSFIDTFSKVYSLSYSNFRNCQPLRNRWISSNITETFEKVALCRHEKYMEQVVQAFP